MKISPIALAFSPMLLAGCENSVSYPSDREELVSTMSQCKKLIIQNDNAQPNIIRSTSSDTQTLYAGIYNNGIEFECKRMQTPSSELLFKAKYIREVGRD